MANSASDAGHSEKEIRQKMIEDGMVDVIVAVGPNMFYNVTLPVTLWFLDRGKKKTDPIRNSASSNGASRKNKVLFIDARNTYRQVDRAHRDWTDEQIEQIAGIVRSYRSENGKKYKDVKGLCKVATIDEVKKAGYSLNPGRYVGVTDNGGEDDGNFGEKVKKLHSELKGLTNEAHDLEKKIFACLPKLQRRQENLKKFNY